MLSLSAEPRQFVDRAVWQLSEMSCHSSPSGGGIWRSGNDTPRSWVTHNPVGVPRGTLKSGAPGDIPERAAHRNVSWVMYPPQSMRHLAPWNQGHLPASSVSYTEGSAPPLLEATLKSWSIGTFDSARGWYRYAPVSVAVFSRQYCLTRLSASVSWHLELELSRPGLSPSW